MIDNQSIHDFILHVYISIEYIAIVYAICQVLEPSYKPYILLHHTTRSSQTPKNQMPPAAPRVIGRLLAGLRTMASHARICASMHASQSIYHRIFQHIYDRIPCIYHRNISIFHVFHTYPPISSICNPLRFYRSTTKFCGKWGYFGVYFDDFW